MNEIKIYRGHEARTMGDRIHVIKHEVSRRTRANTTTMRGLAPEEVEERLLTGNAVVIFDEHAHKLLAYTHLIPGKDATGQVIQGRVEAGAWLAEKGYGRRVMQLAVDLAIEQDAEEIRSLVHQENDTANGAMRKLTGKETPDGQQGSNYVKTTTTSGEVVPAPMNIWILWKRDES